MTQAWSPISGITFYRKGSHGSTLDLQQGRQTIPKSVTPSRIAENFDVVGFELTSDQLAAIDDLDTGVRGGPEPDQFTRETFGVPIPEALRSNDAHRRTNADDQEPAAPVHR